MSGANVDNVFDRVETKVKGLLDENAQLREQNRVLREALEEFCKATEYVASRMAYQCGLGAGEWEACIDQTNYYKQYKQGKAALTATSQPAQEQCSYCKRPLTDNHSFSYGVPGVPRVYKCDRADCTKPATSQEGQG